MKNKLIYKAGVMVLLLVLLQSCSIHDLRSSELKENGRDEASVAKGKSILESAWRAQGFDKLSEHSVYSYHGEDVWKGPLGRMSKVWPESKSSMDFKYRIGSFDGQVNFLNGSEAGTSAGLQNWRFYEQGSAGVTFSDKNAKENKRKVFGLSAFQYFTEMTDRLREAQIISYIGEESFRGKDYDLVFCTWESEVPHMEHDQYVAWIGKDSGVMEFVQYSIRDTYLRPPGYKALGGAVEYADFKTIDGIMIPHTHSIYAIKLRKNPKRNLHRLTLSDFAFDSFSPDLLIVDENIPLGGDYKSE
jgi:hypothetical protein